MRCCRWCHGDKSCYNCWRYFLNKLIWFDPQTKPIENVLKNFKMSLFQDKTFDTWGMCFSLLAVFTFPINIYVSKIPRILTAKSLWGDRLLLLLQDFKTRALKFGVRETTQSGLCLIRFRPETEVTSDWSDRKCSRSSTEKPSFSTPDSRKLQMPLEKSGNTS